MNFNEDTFKQNAKDHILRCRAGDWEHAKRVVHWVNELGDEKDDLYLHIAAGYIHDIGWRDVLPKGNISFDTLLQYEPQANQNSVGFATKFLTENGFSEAEIKKVLRLIEAADRHEALSDDEKIIVDSDMLSKLNIKHIKEKYTKPEWSKMYEYFKTKSKTRLETAKAKKLVPKLLRELENDMNALER